MENKVPASGLKKYIFLFKETITEFSNDRAMKLSAALSYYTIFSLPPLLIVIISMCGIFFGQEAIRGEIFGQISGFVGKDVAFEIQEMIKNITISGNSTVAVIIGLVTLLLGASGVFIEIQDSINYIWGLKAKPKKGFIKVLFNRLMSFAMMGTLGFLLIVGLLINTLIDLLSAQFLKVFPQVTVYLFYLINILLILVILTFLFASVFRTLPDGKVTWKDTIKGAMLTAVLFMIGKFAIGAYLGYSKVATAYGAAGSIIILLLWVYYSSVILYLGAEFTKVFSLNYGKGIVPNTYAIIIEKPTQDEPEKPLKPAREKWTAWKTKII
jgi:membrane protein